MVFGLEVDFVEDSPGPSDHEEQPVQLGEKDDQTPQVTLQGDPLGNLTQGQVCVNGVLPVEKGEHQHARDQEGGNHKEPHRNIVPCVLHL